MMNQKNINQRLSTIEASAYVGCAPQTMKISRVTGRLFGKSAPTYRKLGKKVVYDLAVLQEWIEQFENQKSTAV